MCLRRLCVWSSICLLCAACGDKGHPTPSASSPLPTAPTGPSGTGPNGTFTWISIQTTRPVCPEIGGQVGGSWRIWVKLQTNGSEVTLLMSETSLDNPDPMDDGPSVFKGTRSGNAITAALAPINLGGWSCPGDAGITSETGGDLTATIDGQHLSGLYSNVYGTGPNQVTAFFKFQATLPEGT